MLRNPIAAWLCVIAWAAAIFAASSVPHLAVTDGLVDLTLRKAAHVGEYVVLAVLLRNALAVSREPLHPGPPAAALAIAYAVSDELHQHFVPGRSASPRDVAIDAIGVVLGVTLGAALAPQRMAKAS